MVGNEVCIYTLINVNSLKFCETNNSTFVLTPGVPKQSEEKYYGLIYLVNAE